MVTHGCSTNTRNAEALDGEDVTKVCQLNFALGYKVWIHGCESYVHF